MDRESQSVVVALNNVFFVSFCVRVHLANHVDFNQLRIMQRKVVKVTVSGAFTLSSQGNTEIGLKIKIDAWVKLRMNSVILRSITLQSPYKPMSGPYRRFIWIARYAR